MGIRRVKLERLFVGVDGSNKVSETVLSGTLAGPALGPVRLDLWSRCQITVERKFESGNREDGAELTSRLRGILQRAVKVPNGSIASGAVRVEDVV